jgi:Cysteine-rich CWC
MAYEPLFETYYARKARHLRAEAGCSIMVAAQGGSMHNRRMNSRSADRSTPRRLACTRCGAGFDCRLDDGCWCADESFRLPMPDAAAEDCLCPACLRAVATAAAGAKPA